MQKHFIRTLAIIAGLVVLALIAIVVITQTDWGHGQVRKRVIAAIQGNAHGIVRMGPITGRTRRMHAICL